MQTLVLAILLAAIFALLSQALQRRIQSALRHSPAAVWCVPPALTGIFLLASVVAGTVSGELILIVGVYTAVPVACAWFAGVGPAKQPAALDFAAIALLWLPLEFPAGAARLIAKHAQGFLHSVAYGIAILLGLVIFLCFRQIDGMKYNLPRTPRDLRNTLTGFALTAPVLAVVGIAIGFIPMPHASTASVGKMASAAAIIFCATALPEEILFRSMIQNLLFQRFGATTGTLLLASVIFGAAHLDNGPQALPNWRYMILATIAGFAYGKVFQRSTSVLASTGFHALVDWTKHFFF
jgi:membrane protease YdiL (CAAX protease family)